MNIVFSLAVIVIGQINTGPMPTLTTGETVKLGSQHINGIPVIGTVTREWGDNFRAKLAPIPNNIPEIDGDIWYWDGMNEPILCNTEKVNLLPEQPVAYTVYRNATDQSIVHVQDEIYDINGTVSVWVMRGNLPWGIDYMDTKRAPFMYVYNGTEVIAITDAEGNWEASGSFIPLMVLEGLGVRVINAAGPAQFTRGMGGRQIGDPGNEAASSSTNIYLHTTKSWMFYLDRGWELPTIFAYSGWGSYGCNAFYNEGQIFFLQQLNGCVNSGYSTVIAHEYGHNVVHRLGLIQGKFGEGYCDALASLIFRTPLIGEHFYLDGRTIRDLSDPTIFPCVCGFHEGGMVLAGSWWRIAERLGYERTRDLFYDWSLITIQPDMWGNQSAGPATLREIISMAEPSEYKDIKSAMLELGICGGDINWDNRVNTLDFLAFVNAFNIRDWRGDFNLDGVWNTLDFIEFMGWFDEGC